MGLQLINDKMKEKVTKKQFLKECGFLLLGVLVAPTILGYLINNNRVKMIGNKLLLDDEVIMERR